MFTGLIESLGTVRRLDSDGAGRHLVVAEPALAPQLAIGESVAVNGACLTVVERDAETFRFQVGPETLERTNLGELAVGDVVNLERSLRLGDRLGGHLVQGTWTAWEPSPAGSARGNGKWCGSAAPRNWRRRWCPRVRWRWTASA